MIQHCKILVQKIMKKNNLYTTQPCTLHILGYFMAYGFGTVFVSLEYAHITYGSKTYQ